MATCKFTLLPCPKECKDDSNKVKQFMRKDLDKHLKEECLNRDCSCEHCGEKGTYASIRVHDKTFEKKKVTCPKDGCSEKMQRQNILRHIATDCQHAVIPCKYIPIGCETELKREDMAAHEQDDTVHLHMALDTINVLREDLKNGEPIKFKLTDYQKRKERSECVNSPYYYISPNGYRMVIEVDTNGYGDGQSTHISVFARFVKGRHDNQLTWPFVGKLTFTLLNQLEDKNHHQKTANETDCDTSTSKYREVGHAWGYPKFIAHSALDYDAVKNTQYLKDDTLYFRMSVEPADHKPWLQ